MGGMFSTRWGGHTRHRMIGQGTRELRARDFAALVRSPDTRAAELGGTFAAPGVGVAEWTLSAPRADGTRRLLLEDGGAGVLVVLEPVPQPLGGVRWWLRCPWCRRRRAALYLTPGGRLRAECRVCLRLVYRSQRLAPLPRIGHRCATIAGRVDPFAGVRWTPDETTWPARPRGMHRTTYARHLAELAAAADQYDAVWLGGATRALARLTQRFPTLGR